MLKAHRPQAPIHFDWAHGQSIITERLTCPFSAVAERPGRVRPPLVLHSMQGPARRGQPRGGWLRSVRSVTFYSVFIRAALPLPTRSAETPDARSALEVAMAELMTGAGDRGLTRVSRSAMSSPGPADN